jgi:lipopolysaccharide biosynthesis protein
MNDSMAGPFAPLDRLLDKLHRSPADVWAMTDAEQRGRHLQSYCLGFKGGCLDEGPLRRFWQGVRVEASREDVILRYELGLSRLLRRSRFTTDVAVEGWRVADSDDNPTTIGWRRLLDLGFPFVKRQILREPGVCPDGAMVVDELRRRFGVEADEWL